jgi:hypothetical protein
MTVVTPKQMAFTMFILGVALYRPVHKTLHFTQFSDDAD